jgi:NAD(P)-dependent dehydrogenase (short-subunit alcohol dehydrogenase family)
MKKKLLIFGSTGALGKGVTEVFLKKNYDEIYLFDFKHKEISHDNVFRIIVKDLSEENNVQEAISQVSHSKDSVYYLFSTVGGFTGGKNIWETEIGYFDRMINMNLKTNFLIAKHFSLLVRNSHSGTICLTAAYTGLVEEPGKAVYGISKAALIHLIKTLAEEGKEIGLTANAIAPFIIDTPANREWMTDADFDKWIKPYEIGEFVESIFENYNLISGNIFRLKNRFNKD